MKKLTKLQQRNLEKLHDSTAMENLKEKLLEKEALVIQLKQQLFKAQIALLEADQKEVSKKSERIKQKKLKIKEELKEEVEKVKKHHKIKGSLGYDPDTGEIKEETDV